MATTHGFPPKAPRIDSQITQTRFRCKTYLFCQPHTEQTATLCVCSPSTLQSQLSPFMRVASAAGDWQSVSSRGHPHKRAQLRVERERGLQFSSFMATTRGLPPKAPRIRQAHRGFVGRHITCLTHTPSRPQHYASAHLSRSTLNWALLWRWPRLLTDCQSPAAEAKWETAATWRNKDNLDFVNVDSSLIWQGSFESVALNMSALGKLTEHLKWTKPKCFLYHVFTSCFTWQSITW